MKQEPRINPNEVINLVHQTKQIICDPVKAEDISRKGAADYVTEADKAVQEFLRVRLEKLEPGAVFFAEEQVNEIPKPEAPGWILDPIDGTMNMIRQQNYSAVSLAYCTGGVPVFGVVYNPFTEETFTAQRGKGAFRNGEPIHAAVCNTLSEAIVSFGSSPYNKEFAKEYFPVYQQIYEHCSDFRRGGSAALELCWTAMGRLDAYFERDLKPWDYSAGWLIAEEAGAICRTYAGSLFPAYRHADVLACAPGIYVVLQGYLKDAGGANG